MCLSTCLPVSVSRSPTWSAVCWYDLVLLRRASPLYAPLVYGAAALPRPFCKRLEGGWYPAWIQRPPPTAFDCDVRGLKPGEVCYRFRPVVTAAAAAAALAAARAE